MFNFVRSYAPLILVVLLALGLRLYRIHYPLLDWHSWRQADTASVTREYIKNGIDLLHPRYHDLSEIPNNKDNSQEGYRMVEFPFINAGVALLLKFIPGLPLVPTSRFVSILFSIGTLLSLFFLTKELAGKKIAYLAALTFAVLPYVIFYSRAILPEPAMLFFSTFSILTFHVWIKKKKNVVVCPSCPRFGAGAATETICGLFGTGVCCHPVVQQPTQ